MENIDEIKKMADYISETEERLPNVKLSKDDIIAMMLQEGVTSMEIDGYVIVYAAPKYKRSGQVKRKKKFDMKAFKKAYPTIYKDFLYEEEAAPKLHILVKE